MEDLSRLSQEGSVDHLHSSHRASDSSDQHTAASEAVTPQNTHYTDLASQAAPSRSQTVADTTPPNQANGPAQQLRDLCVLFPHLSEEFLRGLLVESGGDPERAIETLTATDELANAPQPVSLSATHTT